MIEPNPAIIMRLYNAAEYVGEAFDSLFAQDYDGRCSAWVYIDGGSTDGTLDLVKRRMTKILAKSTVKDPRQIHIKAHPHLTLSSATHLALREVAETDSTHVMFLDADCVWYPNRISRHLTLDMATPGVSASRLDIDARVGIVAQGKRVETWQRAGTVPAWPLDPSHLTYEKLLDAGNVFDTNGLLVGADWVRGALLPAYERVNGSYDDVGGLVEDYFINLIAAYQHKLSFQPDVMALYRATPDALSRRTNIDLRTEKTKEVVRQLVADGVI